MEELARIPPEERILLLSHCLRPSEACPGKFSKEGLICPQDCQVECAIQRFRQAALEHGYKGVCVAAGGAMALRFVQEKNPRGILAVACTKELAMGVEGVKKVYSQKDPPAIAVVPLLKDGCVDTEVDAQEVLRAINKVPVK